MTLAGPIRIIIRGTQVLAMSKKLTILIDDSVYEGLHRVVGRGSISKFIENLARPHVAHKDLGAQYREAARDAARERVPPRTLGADKG